MKAAYYLLVSAIVSCNTGTTTRMISEASKLVDDDKTVIAISQASIRKPTSEQIEAIEQWVKKQWPATISGSIYRLYCSRHDNEKTMPFHCIADIAIEMTAETYVRALKAQKVIKHPDASQIATNGSSARVMTQLGPMGIEGESYRNLAAIIDSIYHVNLNIVAVFQLWQTAEAATGKPMHATSLQTREKVEPQTYLHGLRSGRFIGLTQ